MQIIEFWALLCQEFEKWSAVEDSLFRGQAKEVEVSSVVNAVMEVEVKTLQMGNMGKPRLFEAVDVYRQATAGFKRGGDLAVLIRRGNLTV